MADNNFRSYRSRDAVAPEEFDSSREAAGDPLAELARLIGQGDPHGEGGRRERASPAHADDDTASGLDWAADEAYAGEHDRAEDRYVPPSAASYPNLTPQDRVAEDEPPVGPRFFPGPAPKFNGSREDVAGKPKADYAHDHGNAHDHDYGHDHAPDELPPVSAGRHLPPFAAPAYDDHDEADHRQHDGDQAHAGEDYDDAEQPRRRGGFVVVMAVLGLVVVGTAGAFGYRAMFGGSVLPTLPPIIKASNGPNKIMPSYGDLPASNSSQTAAMAAGSTEHLAPPAEQPVDVQQSLQPAPRVVSTIPIVPGGNPVSPGAVSPVGPAPVAPAPVVTAPVVSVPAAPSPIVAPPPPMAAPAPPAAPAPAPAASEPKKVHTVTIRADQPGGRSAGSVPAAPARKPTTPAAAPARANEPLSIVPSAAGDLPAPPAPRTRAEAAPLAVASAGPAGGSEAAAPAGGGYAVQVTSQHSEAEAKAAFRTLRAKFPNQLGGREPIIRRADLGAKGVYYRALVGPFASMEAAAEMCSSLKAAGGMCLIPRN